MHPDGYIYVGEESVLKGCGMSAVVWYDESCGFHPVVLPGLRKLSFISLVFSKSTEKRRQKISTGNNFALCKYTVD
jgi:hypothetical protein